MDTAALCENCAESPEEFLTDQPERFFVAEIVREKLLAPTRDETPYSAGALIDSFKEERGMVRIRPRSKSRDGQTAIVIGKGGEMLKAGARSNPPAMRILKREPGPHPKHRHSCGA